jgi:hypothetical protein
MGIVLYAAMWAGLDGVEVFYYAASMAIINHLVELSVYAGCGAVLIGIDFRMGEGKNEHCPKQQGKEMPSHGGKLHPAFIILQVGEPGGRYTYKF